MRISHKYKFVFFSNPKTGSESIRAMLDPYSDIFSKEKHPIYPNHIIPTKLKVRFVKMGWNWEEYFKFSFVRNPWDRLVSYYYYTRPNRNYRLLWRKRSPWNQINALPFYEFIESLNYRKYGLLNQWKFVFDEDNKRLVNFVGRYEDIEKSCSVICKKLGIEANLPHENITARKTKKYKEYYNSQTKRIVAKVFQKDIDLFGYTF